MFNAVKRWLLKADDGDAGVSTLICCFVMLLFFSLLMNFVNFYLTYISTESKMQSAVTGAIEYAMLDDYRADGTLKADAEIAKAKAREFITSDLGLNGSGEHFDSTGKRVYTVTIGSITASDEPPSITVSGTIDYALPFSILGAETSKTYDFSITSHDVSLVED